MPEGNLCSRWYSDTQIYVQIYIQVNKTFLLSNKHDSGNEFDGL
jgi:hypothetical protein